MNLIVNADRNWGIGFKNSLLVRIPNDMKFFRQHTLGKIVVCGRHTLLSFPGQRPLPDRTTVVLSRNPDYIVKNAYMAKSVDEVLALSIENGWKSEDIYVIGGEMVYKSFLPYCDRAYVTRTDMAYEADAYFPDLEKDPDWELTFESDEETYYDIVYHYTTWERRH